MSQNVKLTSLTYYFVEMLVKVLESNWAVLSEDIGLWIPTEISNQEHDDKPEGVEDTGNCSISPVDPSHNLCLFLLLRFIADFN